MKLYTTDEVRATDAWPYAIASGCVVYRDDKDQVEVLLLCRKGGHPNDPNQKDDSYNLPKGHTSFGETLIETALRETEEEAGVKVEIQTYLGSTIHEFVHPRHGVFNSKTTHYFAAKWVSDITNMDHEHDSKVWVSLDRAAELLSAPGVKRNEAQFIDHLQKFLELNNE